MVPVEEIFCYIDDYCKLFQEQNATYQLPNPNRKRKRPCRMTLSEIMTIIILFQFSHYRMFKDFYLNCVLIQYRRESPNCVSYHRFIELMPVVLMPLACMLTALQGEETGGYFIDSTSVPQFTH